MTFLLSLAYHNHTYCTYPLPVFYIYHFFDSNFPSLFLNVFIHFISIPSLCFIWYLCMLTFLPSSCFKKYFSSSFSLLVLNSIGYSFIFVFKASRSWDFSDLWHSFYDLRICLRSFKLFWKVRILCSSSVWYQFNSISPLLGVSFDFRLYHDIFCIRFSQIIVKIF